jgi:tRNA(Ile)-lysidine synthase TilS/MesJ
MKCIKCSAEATVHLDNLDSCKGCFQKIIQKRIRKEIREKRLIEKGDKILVLDDGSAESKMIASLLREIIKGLPVKIETKRTGYILGDEIKDRFNKIIIPWNADKEGEHLLSCFFEKKKPRYLSHFRMKGKTYIKPLVHVLHKEIAEFCRIRKIKFKEDNKKSTASEMIGKLQKEYPEITFSLVKSSELLEKIIK